MELPTDVHPNPAIELVNTIDAPFFIFFFFRSFWKKRTGAIVFT